MSAGKITGSFTGTGQSDSMSPNCTPSFAKLCNVEVSGTFSAGVQLERLLPGETVWKPITAAGTQLYVWTAPASEQFTESEPGTLYRLNCTAYTSGTVNYRISQ